MSGIFRQRLDSGGNESILKIIKQKNGGREMGVKRLTLLSLYLLGNLI